MAGPGLMSFSLQSCVRFGLQGESSTLVPRPGLQLAAFILSHLILLHL